MKRLVFRTRQEARDYLISRGLVQWSANPNVFWAPGAYICAHGEYERPDYQVVRYKDGWGVKVIHYYYRGTLNVPKDGRIEYDVWGDYADW
jgi:hypothetical protein